jgi:hypothetical protein
MIEVKGKTQEDMWREREKEKERDLSYIVRYASNIV